MQKLDGVFVFGEPKSAQSRRVLTVRAVCVAALREASGDRHRASPGTAEPRPRAAARPRVRLDQRAPGRAPLGELALTRLLRNAGVPSSRVHDLRHTCASLLRETGTPMHEVKELLGHSSIAVTVDIHGHVLDAAKRRVASQMDNLFTARAESDDPTIGARGQVG